VGGTASLQHTPDCRLQKSSGRRCSSAEKRSTTRFSTTISLAILVGLSEEAGAVPPPQVQVRKALPQTRREITEAAPCRWVGAHDQRSWQADGCSARVRSWLKLRPPAGTTLCWRGVGVGGVLLLARRLGLKPDQQLRHTDHLRRPGEEVAKKQQNNSPSCNESFVATRRTHECRRELQPVPRAASSAPSLTASVNVNNTVSEGRTSTASSQFLPLVPEACHSPFPLAEATSSSFLPFFPARHGARGIRAHRRARARLGAVRARVPPRGQAAPARGGPARASARQVRVASATVQRGPMPLQSCARIDECASCWATPPLIVFKSDAVVGNAR
jgi:hypothetical protein